jgi:4-aminobutyrate aminotransferase-like enzyme
MGLMQGIEVVKDKVSKEPSVQAVAQVFEETKNRRVLIGKGGLYGNVLRLGPPLIADKGNIDELIEALDAAFYSVKI